MQLSTLEARRTILSLLNGLKTSRWLWCLIAVVVVAVRYFSVENVPPTGSRFGDTDDALRLVQVRDFLMYGNWYDTTISQMGGGEALVSHGSRLIDLPVAWLISFFSLFTTYLVAELAAQVVWPLILLLMLARFFVWDAERRAGPDAGLIALILLLLCSTGIFQFNPGRIDHHNAQILSAVVGLLLTWRALGDAVFGWWAGAALAVGLVIGFEALPLVAASVGMACLFACFDKGAREGATRTVMTLCLGLIAGYAVAVSPQNWSNVVCDALSPNLLGLTAAGALASALLISRFRGAGPLVWVGIYAAAGTVGIALYLGAEPACVGGAFSGMEPIVKTHWLAGVVEGKTLWQLGQIKPSLAFGYLGVMALTLAVLGREAWLHRDTERLYIGAVVLLAGLYGFYYIKFMPYGALLGLVPLACWIARLPAMGATSASSVRIRAVLLCNQTLFILIASAVISLFSNVEAGAKKKLSSSVSVCSEKADLARLNTLTPGLIISDIDLGPYIAASSRHIAYAGPYHRIHDSLADLLTLLHGPLSEAGAQLAAMKADYVVLCGVERKRKVLAGTPGRISESTFSEHMRRGGSLAGLSPVSIGETKGPLKIWRVVK